MKGHLKRRGGSWAVVVDDKDDNGKRKRRWIKIYADNRKQLRLNASGSFMKCGSAY
jgi:hypothetical protein